MTFLAMIPAALANAPLDVVLCVAGALILAGGMLLGMAVLLNRGRG